MEVRDSGPCFYIRVDISKPPLEIEIKIIKVAYEH
jgi:hypothetical protein